MNSKLIVLLVVATMLAVSISHFVAPVQAAPPGGTFIAQTTEQWAWEYPWNVHPFFANGIIWEFYPNHNNPCQSVNNPQATCLRYDWSNNAGSTWTDVGVNVLCGQYFLHPAGGPFPPESLSVTTNSTHVFVACDTGAQAGTSVGLLGAGSAMYSMIGKLNSDGTITWSAQVQIGPTLAGNQQIFEQENVRVAGNNGQIFVAYRIDFLNDTSPSNCSLGIGCSYPYVTWSTNQLGTSWNTPLKLSTFGCGTAGGAGLGWQINLFPLGASAHGTMMTQYAEYSGDIANNLRNCTSANVGLPRDRFFSAGVWGSEVASGITDQTDGVMYADNAINNVAPAHMMIWADWPSPQGNSNPGFCGFQDCINVFWVYNDTAGTWGHRQDVDPRHTLDEHANLAYDPVTNRPWLFWLDELCFYSNTPPNTFIWIWQSDGIDGGWSTPRQQLFSVTNSYMEGSGGSNGGGCTPNNAGDNSALVGFNYAYTIGGSGIIGIFWQQLPSPCLSVSCGPENMFYGSFQPSAFNPPVFPSESNSVLASLPSWQCGTKGCSVQDDFLGQNAYPSAMWTVDKFQTVAPTNMFTQGGYLWMTSASTTNVTAVHVNIPAWFAGMAPDNTIVKRKMAVGLIPYTQAGASNTSNIRVGFAPLATVGTYPSTSVAGSPNVDDTNNCLQVVDTTSRLGVEYMYIDNKGSVWVVTCGDGANNRLLLKTGLDPTLYTVMTLEFRSVVCALCIDGSLINQQSWVWFRVYQNDASKNLIASSDTSVNFTNPAPGQPPPVVPLANTVYAFVSQQETSKNVRATSRIDFVDYQNFGSLPTTLGQIPSTPSPITQLTGSSTVPDILVYASTYLGGGDVQAGALILFLMIGGLSIGAMIFFTQDVFTSIGLVGSLLVGAWTYEGLFPSWFLFLIILFIGFLGYGIFQKLIGGAKMGLGRGGSMEVED